MEQTQDGGSLSIGELSGGNGQNQERKTIPEGTYKASYTGMKVFFEDTPKWGKKKAVRLMFKITEGPKDVIGRVSSFKGLLSEIRETGAWVIGSKSQLADVVKAITHGGMNIDDRHKNTPVYIEITHSKSKNPDPETGLHKIWDFVTHVSKIASDVNPADVAPAPSAAPAAQAPAATAPAQAPKPAPAPAPVKAPETNAGLLDGLTELGDFKL